MKCTVGLFLSILMCIPLIGCTPGVQEGAIPTVQPTQVPVPTATLDFTGAQATLTVIRQLRVPLGNVTITAAIPLLFAIDENNPEAEVIVWGTGEGSAVLNGTAMGTGGSYTVEGTWPVTYDVRGVLTPSREVCKMTLTAEEGLLMSQEVIVHAGPLGDIPMVGGVDEFTAFPELKFTEIEATVTIGTGEVESVFTIDDWCMPNATYCTYGCQP